MRNDIHTPSQIVPSDYQYVAVWTMNIQGFGDAQFILQERETIRRHMDRTKGEYARVETSGSCQVCGNVQAIYLALFYHVPTNTYIRIGFDCTTKLEMSGDTAKFNLFRRNVQNAREAQAGKRKAIAILADANNSSAWDIYNTAFVSHLDTCKGAGFNSFGDNNAVEKGCDCDSDNRWKLYNSFEETVIRDIVGKLVKYGNVSPKQMEFVGNLLRKIEQRPLIEAARKAEKDAAGPVPVGRVTLTGKVISVKEVERPTYHYGDTGMSTKVTIKLENGSVVYGNRFENIEKGQQITFVATVKASDRDPKFGFFSRPALPKRELSKVEKKAKKVLNHVLRTLPWEAAHETWGTPSCNVNYESHATLKELIAEIENGEVSEATL